MSDIMISIYVSNILNSMLFCVKTSYCFYLTLKIERLYSTIHKYCIVILSTHIGRLLRILDQIVARLRRHIVHSILNAIMKVKTSFDCAFFISLLFYPYSNDNGKHNVIQAVRN